MGNPSFGSELRRLREAVGLTQEELADRAGLTPRAISSLERGERKRPYPHTVRSLADALGLSEERQSSLLALTRAGRDAATPSAPPPAALPTPPTPIVGRERELGEVTGLLRAGVRLVTLTGPGGVGKTRLTLELVTAVTDAFPDGTKFITLAPLTDSALVLPTVARALGLMDVGERPPIDALRAHLRDMHMLIALDNFEHVLDAAVEMADLLASCPGLTVIATSRAPLRVRGEREYPVGPLPVPEMGHVPEVAEVAASPAVELFVERAQSVAPDFELTRSNTTAVTAICRRLDGLPLALELAAAWVRTLDPTSMLARLDRVLPLLSGGARDLPDRQRTMEAAVEWSMKLLDPGEQELFRRLSVFRGGWNLEAAEALGG